MTTASRFGTFFVPGPTEVRSEVLAAMSGPMIPHRSAAFETLFADAQVGLKEVFQTKRPVMITASSATGLMESALRCLPQGRVLCLVNGAFSQRFSAISEACGHQTERYEVEWGEVHDPDRVRQLLANGNFAAVTVVHSETSTGARNPVKKISDIAHEAGAKCLIDSVSGAGGIELQFDEWNLDLVLTGSQKAIALPPGLGFAVASESFIEDAKRAPARGVYFDLIELDTFAKQNQTPSTPAVSLFYAMKEQFKAIHAKGMESRWADHTAMANMTDDWADALASETGVTLRNIVAKGSRSQTVSTLRIPDGWNTAAFLGEIAKRGFTVASGYGKLRDTTIRIGHMGDHTVQTLKPCLEACAEVLRETMKSSPK
ncbi:MAG: alanine--glyoxylate aminotransferase family protein [Gemmatimonadaceae bacterium]|nr:alanine--glyoxylate aminotransferase family protein [Gemmatimonadaceae bacterium]